MKKKSRSANEVNASSMADIAFLLLIFFLVTTTIDADKGLPVQLPPKKEDQQDVKINQRNIFNILINSYDMLLAEEELISIKDLKREVKKFVNNRGTDPKSSESPQKAVVSLKTDRGTSYKVYIAVLDELKMAYNELRAEYLDMSLEEYNGLDAKNPEHEEKLARARAEYPYQVSDAEPTDISALN